ncbi:Putative beta-glucuronidase [Phycisphaerales bacterium]|nr:Putative beta-glucuronidase [Phycisphaerales bacterium]
MTSIDLSGTWKIRHDPLSQGLTDGWRDQPIDDRWRDISVPSAWQSVLGADANGVAWYRRSLPGDVQQWTQRGQRVLLRFESVATECWVWVNGVEVGRHVGDWIPFEFDITGALNAGGGAAALAVRVDQVHAPRPPRGVVVENGHVTKGFHDVLSLQHAGIWGAVSVRAAKKCTVPPNGLSVLADPLTGRVRAEVELVGMAGPFKPAFAVTGPDGGEVARGFLERDPASGKEFAEFTVVSPSLWSPQSPSLYSMEVTPAPPSNDVHLRRFGFRTIATGGPGNSQILLNGKPLRIRGVLSWGHEPAHIAPALPPERVRAEFGKFKELGFNCVCLCMFYAPEYFYDIADEMGMLLWQEHPVWKSRMSPDFLPEYKRLYTEFIKRDRAHPSVIIVSGTCEHEAFNEDLSAWWWKTASEMLPRTLKQIQTGFLEWTPRDRTDLYDDHVYDNPGRWVRFLDDMQSRIAELPPKPFVMGETIISNAWPDIAAYRAKIGSDKPWWISRGLDQCGAFESALEAAHGADTLNRFREQAREWGPRVRKFFGELLWMHPRNAGFVTNSVRDVPICRIGLMDDLDAWRFTPEDTRAWLADAPILLSTPNHLRGFRAGTTVAARVAVANWGASGVRADVAVRVGGTLAGHAAVRADPGVIGEGEIEFELPDAAAATIVECVAAADGLVSNRWRLAAFPDEPTASGVACLTGAPFTDAEREPEFEERRYSSGWGLACRTWLPLLPDPAALAPNAAEAPANAPVPASTKVLLTHRWTREAAAWVRAGGRALLLAHRHPDGGGSKWINLWGLLPLVIESDRPGWPVRPGESAAILAMLLHDFTGRTTRAVHSQDLGFHEHVLTIVRYFYTHDSGAPNIRDAVFAARIGRGLLVVSTLDHSTPAGRWFLNRLMNYAAATSHPPEHEIATDTWLTAR